MTQSTTALEVPAFAIALAATCEKTSPMEAWEAFGEFSDIFKDVHGMRPRSACLIPVSMADLNKRIDSLQGEIDSMIEDRMNEKERGKKRMAELLKPSPPVSIGDLFPSL